MRVRVVAPPKQRCAFATHARLRRTSPISQYAVAAALEALEDARSIRGESPERLGIVLCSMCGCVNYSRRFYRETLNDPVTASPLVFPETVFNAPASHLAALLGTGARCYTLVGDPGTFLQGIALAAQWLRAGQVDGCLIIGVEEMDWLVANSIWLFDREVILSEGAGALYLCKGDPRTSGVCLRAVTHPRLFTQRQSRARAAQLVRAELGQLAPDGLLCDGLQSARRTDLAEACAWDNWAGGRLSPKRVLGEGLMAAAAWQCVAAVHALASAHYSEATVSVVGCNQQAIAAQFQSCNGAGLDGTLQRASG